VSDSDIRADASGHAIRRVSGGGESNRDDERRRPPVFAPGDTPRPVSSSCPSADKLNLVSLPWITSASDGTPLMKKRDLPLEGWRR
jgi:hypothetical protein